jgi:hypothetical protein
VVYGGRRLKGFMPLFWESLFSVICFYVAVPVTFVLIYKAGSSPNIAAPEILLLLVWSPVCFVFFIFVTILAFVGSVAGFITALSIRR